MKKINLTFVLIIAVISGVVGQASNTDRPGAELKMAACPTSCDQSINTIQNVVKYQSMQSGDTWKYFGSKNQTRVRVKVEYKATPMNPQQFLCASAQCPSGYTGNTQMGIILSVKCEAEWKNLAGNWVKSQTYFSPKFELEFLNFNIINRGNFTSPSPNGPLCNLPSTCNLLPSCFIYSNSQANTVWPSNNTMPTLSNWIQNGWTILQNNVTQDYFELYNGICSITCANAWFTEYPQLFGTINCRVKIGANSFSNIGSIVF
jgi:hypothetical protein